MIGFELEKNMNQCPRHWYNFICDLQKQKKEYYRDVSMQRIQQALKLYGARYRLNGSRPNPTIEFETEQGYMMFLLRWA